MAGVIAMSAVRAVHEEVAADEDGDQRVITDGAQRDAEDEDRHQRDDEA